MGSLIREAEDSDKVPLEARIGECCLVALEDDELVGYMSAGRIDGVAMVHQTYFWGKDETAVLRMLSKARAWAKREGFSSIRAMLLPDSPFLARLHKKGWKTETVIVSVNI